MKKILTEDQIIYLSTYIYFAHKINVEENGCKCNLKFPTTIAIQLRQANHDGAALHEVLDDWLGGLNDPMLSIIQSFSRQLY